MPNDNPYPDPQPHGPLEPVMPEVWVVYGSIRMAPLMRVGRNMVVCRRGDELTLLNPVRLNEQGEAGLERLGRVANIVRLGCFHGMDDRYYVDRYGATFWCQSGSTHHPEPAPDVVIDDDTLLPVDAARVVTFRETRQPECVVLIERDGGLLVTCDSLQNYTDMQRTSFVARLVMKYFGFRRELIIGPLWLRYMTSKGGDLRSDYARLAELRFDKLIAAHGVLYDGGADAAVAAAIRRTEFSH